MAIGHGMLGWLSMLHRGFLHRDIGAPTVFLLRDPVEMASFVPGNFEQVLGESQDWKDDQILQDQVERLREAIAELRITSACSGVVEPSDMAVDMKDYYASGGNTHKSDSYDFMSSGLLRSIRLSEQYLHSPVDDLESFYYTMQWIAAHHGEGPDIEVGKLKSIILEGLSGSADDRFQASLAVHKIRQRDKGDLQEFGEFLVKIQPVLKEWYPMILGLVKSWKTVKDGVDGDDVSGYYIRNALVFAYRGVADFLGVVKRNKYLMG